MLLPTWWRLFLSSCLQWPCSPVHRQVEAEQQLGQCPCPTSATTPPQDITYRAVLSILAPSYLFSQLRTQRGKTRLCFPTLNLSQDCLQSCQDGWHLNCQCTESCWQPSGNPGYGFTRRRKRRGILLFQPGQGGFPSISILGTSSGSLLISTNGLSKKSYPGWDTKLQSSSAIRYRWGSGDSCFYLLLVEESHYGNILSVLRNHFCRNLAFFFLGILLRPQDF